MKFSNKGKHSKNNISGALHTVGQLYKCFNVKLSLSDFLKKILTNPFEGHVSPFLMFSSFLSLKRYHY